MIDSFLKAPLWIQIIVMAIIVSLVAFFIYKGVAAEKIKIGKDGLELDDMDAHSEIKDAGGKIITTVDTTIKAKDDEKKV